MRMEDPFLQQIINDSISSVIGQTYKDSGVF